MLPSIFRASWQSLFRYPHLRATVVTVTASMFSGFVFDTISSSPSCLADTSRCLSCLRSKGICIVTAQPNNDLAVVMLRTLVVRAIWALWPDKHQLDPGIRSGQSSCGTRRISNSLESPSRCLSPIPSSAHLMVFPMYTTTLDQPGQSSQRNATVQSYASLQRRLRSHLWLRAEFEDEILGSFLLVPNAC